MRKFLILALPFLVFAQNRYLTSVVLDNERLDPLYATGLKIIGEFEHYAFCLIEEKDMAKLHDFQFKVLEINPGTGPYYFIRTNNSNIDLKKYGQVLLQDNNDFFIRLFSSPTAELMAEPVNLKHVTFKPIIRGSKSLIHSVSSDPTIQEIVSLIHPDSILATVQRLQDFVTRYSTHDSCDAAAAYIENRFNQYGCDSVFVQNYLGGHAPNVIAVKTGNVYPDSIYTVACGHFDSYSVMAPNIAPGADDNASGTASVIEACRVMQNYEFEYSVRYIAFSGEEFGLLGSAYYAANARNANDSILGVFNADMISYVNALPESIEVIASLNNPPCGPFCDFFIACADTYANLLTRRRLVNSWIPSDNQSFNDYGYIALLNIDDYNPITNPWYHQPGDTIGSGFNNLAFCTEVTRAQTAALATMAVPYNTVVSESSFSTRTKRHFSITPSIGEKFLFQLDSNERNAIVSIYNCAGIKVNQFNTNFPFVWDGTNNNRNKLAAGVYFVKVEAEGSIFTGKAIISR